MKNVLAILLFFSINALFSQPDFKKTEENLAFHADVMINASKPAHRMIGADHFNDEFWKILQAENSFVYPFDSLSWVSKIQDSENKFRIFSWQIQSGVASYKYFGIIQLNDGRIYRLKDHNLAMEDLPFVVLNHEQWYGQLYYAIHEQKSKEGKQYILFGYKELNDGKVQKIAAPFVFTSETLEFGKEIFFKSSRHGDARIVIEYSHPANAGLRYDADQELIIYDHLVPVINPYEGNKTLMVPDGTLEAYSFEKNKWIYKDRVFDQKYENAPVPQPLKRDKNKNIIGR